MLLALGGVAVCSGMAALLFETLFFRLAGLVFGNSVWASSIVLTGFMGGLGLGNLWALGPGARSTRPARAYAIVESLAGASGVLLVLILPRAAPVLAPFFARFGPAAVNPVRLLAVLVLLLVPTTAMGATLPLLVLSAPRKPSGLGPTLGLLYGANCLGAVAGALVGELVLISGFGLSVTGLVAGALDLTAAGLALALSGSSGSLESPGPDAQEAPARSLLAAALAGGILLALEVVWFRFLLLFVAGFALTFAIMLAVVLLGISAGGFLAGAWLRRNPEAHRFLAPVALVAGIAGVLAYSRFDDAVNALKVGYTLEPSLIGALSAWLMLPTCVLSGMIFTLLGAALERGLGNAARTTGSLSLANTFGAAAGAWAGGFLLLPHLGIERSLLLLSLLYGVVAALVVPRRALSQQERFRLVATAGAFALVIALFPFGFMRNVVIPRIARHYAAGYMRTAASREGLTETLIYLESERFGVHDYRLVTNGFAMAATNFFVRRYMRLFAYWPLAVQGHPRTALLVSYGLGSTATSLTRLQSLSSIDVVDISRDILDMGHTFFPDPGSPPLVDSRVHSHVEDGRFFLLTTDKKYDIVTSEPPPPRLAGVVNLYTQEYFSMIRDRLNPGGVVTYWLPIYMVDQRAARGLVKGFCAAFPDCTLWTGSGLELMLVGTRDLPGPIDPETIEAPWKDPGMARELRWIGLDSPEALGSLFVADAPFLASWAAGVPALRDDTPGVLTGGPLVPTRDDDPGYRLLTDARASRDRFRTSRFIETHWPAGLRQRTLEAFDDTGVFNKIVSRQDEHTVLLDVLLEALRNTKSETLPLLAAGGEPRVMDAVLGAASRGERPPGLDYWLGLERLSHRDYAAAVRLFGAAAQETPQSRALVELRALSLCLGGEGREAQDALAAIPGAQGNSFWSQALATCPG
jgi:spermidine synthase